MHAETAAVVGLDEEVGGMADGHVEGLIQARLLSPVENFSFSRKYPAMNYSSIHANVKLPRLKVF